MRRTLLLVSCVFGLPVWMGGCADDPSLLTGEEASAKRVAAAPTWGDVITLDTFDARSLQIDQDIANPPGDANLYASDDPADASPSWDLPAGGTTYIDWEDLAGDIANHQYTDFENTKGKDTSAFPRSDSCVGPAHVLSKMDLTYVAVANNTEHASFAVQRANNNGDAGYYWLITKEVPSFASSSRCRSTERELAFDLSGPDTTAGTVGDLMLAGHFMGSDTPLLTVYRAVGDTTGTLAVDALDFEDPSLWSEVDLDHPAAVNETTTRAGSFGAEGVDASDGVDLEPEVFAEAAVQVDLLQGTDVCTGTFYATVITRSSGAGGTSPDLKDVAGPFALNFEPVSATATLEPLCEGMVWYEATPAEGLDVTCDWLFDDGTVVTDSCSGSVAVTPGTRYATVTVTATDTPCADEVVTDSVEVGGPMDVVVMAEGTCDETLVYAGEVTGAVGDVTYEWTFLDELGNVLATATGTGGEIVLPPGAVTAELSIVDDRGDGLLCPAEAPPETTNVVEELELTAELLGGCAETLHYEASATGGDGTIGWEWRFGDGWVDTAPSGDRILGTQPSGGTEWTAEVSASWTAEDGAVCTSTYTPVSAWVYSPIDVHLTPDGRGGECPTTDAVTWTASVTGGGPGLTLDWTVDSCDGALTCTVNPDDADTCETVDVQLTVGDPGVCDDAASEHETYEKVTVIVASDN